MMRLCCNGQLEVFLKVCEEINFPVALEKTFWGSTLMTFLGLLLDTERQLICIPLEKICKGIEMIEKLLNKKRWKSASFRSTKTLWVFEFPVQV